MMGSGLLAEMKAKQERRAHKVRREEFYSGTVQRSKCSVFTCESCIIRSFHIQVHVQTLRIVCICRLVVAAVNI